MNVRLLRVLGSALVVVVALGRHGDGVGGGLEQELEREAQQRVAERAAAAVVGVVECGRVTDGCNARREVQERRGKNGGERGGRRAEERRMCQLRRGGTGSSGMGASLVGVIL